MMNQRSPNKKHIGLWYQIAIGASNQWAKFLGFTQQIYNFAPHTRWCCELRKGVLGVQTNYPFALTFFLRTPAAAFPTSYCMKTVCSCWVWKLNSDACPQCIMHFIIQSALLDYSFLFLILVCYIKLVYQTWNFQIASLELRS